MSRACYAEATAAVPVQTMLGGSRSCSPVWRGPVTGAAFGFRMDEPEVAGVYAEELA